MKLDVPGSVFTHAGEQQHQLIEGEVAQPVSGENFTNSLPERILLQFWTLGQLTVGKLHTQQLIVSIRISWRWRWII